MYILAIPLLIHLAHPVILLSSILVLYSIHIAQMELRMLNYNPDAIIMIAVALIGIIVVFFFHKKEKHQQYHYYAFQSSDFNKLVYVKTMNKMDDATLEKTKINVEHKLNTKDIIVAYIGYY